MNKKPLVSGVAAALLSLINAHAGSITTDGTTGAALSLAGPKYTIPQSLGTTAGNNLFHSFGTFNLNQNDIATFTGANTLQNVISRVTGGTASSIDGTIKSEIGSANFFFINPAGVIFGKHAAIDVPAAFHISTAQELRFADGKKYSAVMPAGSSLTSSPPEAFGFLQPGGPIQFQKSQLAFQEKSAVTIAGGSIEANEANLTAPSGNLRIYGQGDMVGVVLINGDLPEGNGTITLNGGIWDVSGNGAGNLYLSGGKINLNSASIYNHNTGDEDAPGKTRINAKSFVMDGGAIKNRVYAQGNGVNVFLDIRGDLLGQNHSVFSTGVYDPNATGTAGNLSAKVGGDLQLINGSFIANQTAGKGDVGNVAIAVNGAMQILNEGRIGSDTLAQGNAGNVDVRVGKQITLLNGGVIASATFAQGNAGIVQVQANGLIIGEGNSLFTGISSDSLGDIGQAGVITVAIAGEIQILGGGAISSSSFGSGDAGNVTVQAGSLIIDSQDFTDFVTGIGTNAQGTTGKAGSVTVAVNGEMQVLNGGSVSSATWSQGNAGTVAVQANKINLLNGGAIGTDTFAQGDAGTVQVQAGNLTLDSQSFTAFDTGISSQAHPKSTGRAGSVTVEVADTIQISGEYATVSSSNLGTNAAGPVNVIVGKHLDLNAGKITTSAITGNGGPITLTAPLLVLNNAQVTTSVSGENGNGGDINVSCNYLVMDTGFIQANTAAKNAKGGNILIDERNVIGNGGIISVGGLNRENFVADSGKNIIQAAAPDGVSGNVTLSSPDTSNTAGIIVLDNSSIEIKPLTNPCHGVKKRASLKHKGRRQFPVKSIIDGTILRDSAEQAKNYNVSSDLACNVR